MSTVLAFVSWVLLMSGGALCISGAVGMLRFPDVYTRMHAAGVTDTLGSGLIIVGLMLQTGLEFLILAKLLLIVSFLFITIPTSSHALAMAALHSGLQPLLGSAGDSKQGRHYKKTE